jgi:spore coat protein CotH
MLTSPIRFRYAIAALWGLGFASIGAAQPPDFFGGRGGPGGPGRGGVREPVRLVQQFDQNGDKILDAAERKAAREYLSTQPRPGRRPRGRGPFGPGGNPEPPAPGPKLSPADVKQSSDEPLYDITVLRTLFLEFESADWEKELADFYDTDVEVPARLTVDGKHYPDIGVRFRGASSFMMVPEGRKRSFNLSMNFVHEGQRLGGYRTLNLLNANQDPTFLRTVLFHQIARQYIPAPKANHVRVVINGESWGIYVNAQQFNSEFTKEWFSSTKGRRWKVPGSPGGRGGLAYVGDDAATYKRLYEIKTKNEPKAWADLIRLCKVLNETPPEKLEAALEPLLDIDGVLKFLALDKTFINNDGYWTRASDYSIYQDEKGRFHVIPHDANETFQPAERGGRGFALRSGPPKRPGPDGFPGPGGRGPGGAFPIPGGPPGEQKVDLDPFEGADDANKPLLSKLLAVPALRARYLSYMKNMAETWLDWNRLEPLIAQYQALIAPDVRRDTRKLGSNEAFTQAVRENIPGQGFGPFGPAMGLKVFAERRREYLLNHTEVRKAPRL